jgi:hypothetical protein
MRRFPPALPAKGHPGRGRMSHEAECHVAGSLSASSNRRLFLGQRPIGGQRNHIRPAQHAARGLLDARSKVTRPCRTPDTFFVSTRS